MREASGRARKVGSVLRLFSVVMLIAVLASVVGVGASAKPVQACACLDVNIVAPDRFPVGSPFAVSAIIWNRCDCIADNVRVCAQHKHAARFIQEQLDRFQHLHGLYRQTAI